jgi:hypothetical protein
LPLSAAAAAERVVRLREGARMAFPGGYCALVAFAVAALFLLGLVLVIKHQPRRLGAILPLGVAVVAWLGYGAWELYLMGGT